MTRIVFLTNSASELGGAQRIVHLLAQEFALRGNDVTILGIVPPQVPHVFVENPAYREVTLLPVPLPAWVPSTWQARVTPSLRRRAAERAALRRAAVDGMAAALASGPSGIVIGAQVWALEHLAEVSTRAFNPRQWGVIAQHHGSFAAAAGGRDLARILRTCSSVDALCALTDEDAKAFRASGLNNVVTMPNPVTFWPDEPADGRSRRLLFLGRLAVEKAPELLIDSWGRMCADVPQWSLDVVGSGPIESEVRGAAVGVPRVRVLPPLRDSEAAMLSSGAFALPSLAEGSPLALLEAMACGVPVVATDCSSGVRELVIDGETGLLVRSADPAALAQGLRRLLTSGDLRSQLSTRARRHVADRAMASIVERWERLFRDVLR